MTANDTSARNRSVAIDLSGFDYATVSPEVARYLKGHASRLRQYISKSIIQIGKDLLAAKRYLPHGAFLQWVDAEAGINPRTAQSYMHAAQWAANKSATVARLPPGLLYILSATSTPPEYVEDVIERAEAGERLTLTKVRAELRDICQRKVSLSDRESVTECHSVSDDCSNSADIFAVVSILANALPTDKFRKICEIMTSSSVLCRPDLPNAICSAFRMNDDDRMGQLRLGLRLDYTPGVYTQSESVDREVS